MEIHKIEAQPRKTIGKGPARALRRGGRIPAVLYGPETDNILLSLDIHGTDLLLKKINYAQALLNLVVDTDPVIDKTVMIKEVTLEPLTKKLRHVDFYEINMNKKLTVTVPVMVTGVSKGVEEGGILQIIRRELEIHCLPDAIPEHIAVDVTNLGIGDAIHVNDITLDGKVEIPHDVNFTIVTVVSPKRTEGEVRPVEEVEAEPPKS